MVRVAGREHVFTAPAMQHPLGAHLGEGAALLGYDRCPPAQTLALQPGETLRLTLYWQGVAPMDDVVHRLCAAARRRQPPGRPARCTARRRTAAHHKLGAAARSWPTLHTLTVRADAQPGEYRLVVGLYDAASGARLPVLTACARACLASDRAICSVSWRRCSGATSTCAYPTSEL